MTLAVPGTTGFVAPARCAVIKHEGKYFAAVAAPDVRDHKYGGWRIIGRPDQTRLWGPGNDESPRIESKGRWARSNHWAQSALSPQGVRNTFIKARLLPSSVDGITAGQRHYWSSKCRSGSPRNRTRRTDRLIHL